MKPSSRTLDIQVRRTRRTNTAVSVVRFEGPVASDTAEAARSAITPVIEQTKDSLVFELDAVDVLDSTGLMLLTGTFARLRRERRRLVLCTSNERVLALLRVTGLRKLFTVCPTLDEAIVRAAAADSHLGAPDAAERSDRESRPRAHVRPGQR